MDRDFQKDVEAGVMDAIYRVRVNDAAIEAGGELGDIIGDYFRRKSIKNDLEWWDLILNGTVVVDPDLRKVIDWKPWADKVHSYPRPLFGANEKAQQIATEINDEFRKAGYPVDDMLRTLEQRRLSWAKYVELGTRDDRDIAKFGRLPNVDFKDFANLVENLGELGVFDGYLVGEDAQEVLETLGYGPEMTESFEDVVFVDWETCEECGYEEQLARAFIFYSDPSMKDTQLAEWNSMRNPPSGTWLFGNGWYGRYAALPQCFHPEFVNGALLVKERLSAAIRGPHLPYLGLDELGEALAGELGDSFSEVPDLLEYPEAQVVIDSRHASVFEYQGPLADEEGAAVMIRIQEHPIEEPSFSALKNFFRGDCYEGFIYTEPDSDAQTLLKRITSFFEQS